MNDNQMPTLVYLKKTQKFLRRSFLILILLVLVSSCVTGGDQSVSNESNSDSDTSSNSVLWEDKTSLLTPISQALAKDCPLFPGKQVNIAFKDEYSVSKLRTYEVDGAIMHVYHDGAFNPDVEDDFSLLKYYEEWGCKSDTLYISELRFSDKDFDGNVSPTYLFDCVDRYIEEPNGLIITCADAYMRVESIVWSSWNTIEATGIGIFSENNCNPDCASGTIVEQEATIRLGSVKKDSSGKNVFTEIAVETAKAQKSGGYFDTYELYYRE